VGLKFDLVATCVVPRAEAKVNFPFWWFLLLSLFLIASVQILMILVCNLN
jgi:hypothetical protein